MNNKRIVLENSGVSITFQRYGSEVKMIYQEIYATPVETIMTIKNAKDKIGDLIGREFEVTTGKLEEWS